MAVFGLTTHPFAVERHWHDMMQVVLSIQAGRALPSLPLQKLGSPHLTEHIKRFRKNEGHFCASRWQYAAPRKAPEFVPPFVWRCTK